MMCYKDMTFCISPECENKCGRKLTSEIKIAAEKWMKNAPIACACFCGRDLEESYNLVFPEDTLLLNNEDALPND